MLQALHGGAAARPFATHSNALDIDLYLRIALELYLKRLVVGGIERVYEIGRNFRNEGVDTSHNPEFTMLEFYEAYGDYDAMAELTRAARAGSRRRRWVAGSSPTAAAGRSTSGEPGAACTVHDAISDRRSANTSPPTPPQSELRRLAERADVALQARNGTPGRSCSSSTSNWSRASTVEPTFYRDFPVEVSPLVRRHRGDPRLTERWDLVVLGRELGTGYTELVDPVEQRARLTEQSLLAAGGDPEAMQLDADFLRALEFAMPPTGGVGSRHRTPAHGAHRRDEHPRECWRFRLPETSDSSQSCSSLPADGCRNPRPNVSGARNLTI